MGGDDIAGNGRRKIVSILRNGAIRGNRIEPTADILREMMAAIYFNLNDDENFNLLRGWRGWLR